MKCDLCSNKIQEKNGKYAVIGLFIPPDKRTDMNVCEECFMSFEYWKDSLRCHEVDSVEQ